MKNHSISKTLLLILVVAFSFGCSTPHPTKSHKYIVELIGDELDLTKIAALAKENGIEDPQLYKWNNHVVIYSHINTIDDFSHQITQALSAVQVKVYDQPFYNFTKAERCNNADIAPQWKHILLTANLVADEKMQQEYLNYHKTQFTQWPEISKGFCNADFQQLLVYKNGRQLMLVISIPANKTLYELNPKTTENNPRVDDWNQIMGNYQEGIAGTAPNEKWVFLSPVE